MMEYMQKCVDEVCEVTLHTANTIHDGFIYLHRVEDLYSTARNDKVGKIEKSFEIRNKAGK